MRANVVELSQAEDPKEYILRMAKKPLKGHVTLGDHVLIATYIRPNVTRGGIILTDKSIEEDRWQSKTGLILDVGPSAFKFERIIDGKVVHIDIPGPTPKVGDWVQFFPSDGREFFVGAKHEDGGICCRKISSQLLNGIVEDPGSIY